LRRDEVARGTTRLADHAIGRSSAPSRWRRPASSTPFRAGSSRSSGVMSAGAWFRTLTVSGSLQPR